MYAVSSGFLTALTAPSIRSVLSVQTRDGIELAVNSGSVSMDSRRGITRTCELELLPTATLSAQQVFDLVMSPDIEIVVKRGILVNGTAELVPLGVFSTDTASISKSVAGTVSWNGSDRAKKISRSRFIDPYKIAKTTTIASAVSDLLKSRWSQVDVDFSNVTGTITADVTFDAGDSSDPWEVARTLMEDYGYDLNFNGDGVARAVPIPDPAAQEVAFDFGSGDTSLILGGDQDGTLEQTWNGVVASGEGSGVATPVRAVVWDDDPNSPTYYQGGFGPVPYFYSSPLLTTVDLCTVVATALLAKVKGRRLGLSWSAIVNPALEPLDVVSTTFDGVTSTLVLDKLTVPLRAAESMSLIAREVRVA